MRTRQLTLRLLVGLALVVQASPSAGGEGATIASTPTRAQAADGSFISWREHLVDDRSISGVALEGGDGLQLADLDRDGHLDVVAVFEADTVYGQPRGLVRAAFGTGDPDRWVLATLAEDAEAAGAEDVAIGDVNGDGWPDVVVACELAHLLYLQNPGSAVRTARWERTMPPVTQGRGSYIRVYLGDLDGDGSLEVVAPNKGGQNPPLDTTEEHAISWFDPGEQPVAGEWKEHEIARARIPVNSHLVDLDGDGDLDVMAGSRGEQRIFWLENRGKGDGGIDFAEHPIAIDAAALPPTWLEQRYPVVAHYPAPMITGFAFAFADLSADGRLDVVVEEGLNNLLWLEQPADPGARWKLHPIGSTYPDHVVGITLADIDGDGALDLMTGTYSAGPRDRDVDPDPAGALGRLAWFRNPGHDGRGAGDGKGDASAGAGWTRHDISRRQRGMFDQFAALDLDRDGDLDFLGTRGNSEPFDGLFWLEQVRTAEPAKSFTPARRNESPEVPLPK